MALSDAGILRRNSSGHEWTRISLVLVWTRKMSDLEDEGDEQYQVEAVIAHRINPQTKQKEWRVKWKDYGPEENSWEPKSNFLSDDGLTVNEFFREYEKKRKMEESEKGVKLERKLSKPDTNTKKCSSSTSKKKESSGFSKVKKNFKELLTPYRQPQASVKQLQTQRWKEHRNKTQMKTPTVELKEKIEKRKKVTVLDPNIEESDNQTSCTSSVTQQLSVQVHPEVHANGYILPLTPALTDIPLMGEHGECINFIGSEVLEDTEVVEQGTVVEDTVDCNSDQLGALCPNARILTQQQLSTLQRMITVCHTTVQNACSQSRDRVEALLRQTESIDKLPMHETDLTEDMKRIVNQLAQKDGFDKLVEQTREECKGWANVEDFDAGLFGSGFERARVAFIAGDYRCHICLDTEFVDCMEARKGIPDESAIECLVIDETKNVTLLMDLVWDKRRIASLCVDRAETLQESGADFEACCTPLQHICSIGGAKFVNMQSSDHRWTALHVAVWSGPPEFVRTLIEAGAIVSLCDRDGTSALQLAVKRGHMGITKMLLVNGANMHHIDKVGKCASDDCDSGKIADVLEEWRAKLDSGFLKLSLANLKQFAAFFSRPLHSVNVVPLKHMLYSTDWTWHFGVTNSTVRSLHKAVLVLFVVEIDELKDDKISLANCETEAQFLEGLRVWLNGKEEKQLQCSKQGSVQIFTMDNLCLSANVVKISYSEEDLSGLPHGIQLFAQAWVAK